MAFCAIYRYKINRSLIPTRIQADISCPNRIFSRKRHSSPFKEYDANLRAESVLYKQISSMKTCHVFGSSTEKRQFYNNL